MMVEWLNAIIYEMAVRKMLFGQFLVWIEDGRLAGTLRGEPVDAYKDGGVMVAAAEQGRLARRVARPKPLICIKG
jgi:hypothetical protein